MADEKPNPALERLRSRGRAVEHTIKRILRKIETYKDSGHPHMEAWRARLFGFRKGEEIRAKLEELAELGVVPKELVGNITIEPPAGSASATGSGA